MGLGRLSGVVSVLPPVEIVIWRCVRLRTGDKCTNVWFIGLSDGYGVLPGDECRV